MQSSDHDQVPALLADMGHKILVHTIITGGQALLDTLHNFAQLVGQFPAETRFVVWLNPYWGPIEDGGKSFEQMRTYATHKDRVAAIVQIPAWQEATFGRGLGEMLQERLTFDEALAMDSRTIMTRQRLKIIQRQLYGQLDNAMVL